MFRLRKWYFDALSPAGEFFFAYYASMQVARVRVRSLVVHVAREGVETAITRAYRAASEGSSDDGEEVHAVGECGLALGFSRSAGNLHLDAPDCALELRFDPRDQTCAPPVEIAAPCGGRILWKPLSLRSCVTGSLTVNGAPWSLRGVNGYVDYLETTCLPFLTPVRTLRWGRMHHHDADLVFVHARDRTGRRSWSSLCARAGDATVGSRNIVLRTDTAAERVAEAGASYTITARDEQTSLDLRITHLRPMQNGSFLDHQKFRSRAARLLAGSLTRDPCGTKFLSLGDLRIQSGMTRSVQRVPMIDEVALL